MFKKMIAALMLVCMSGALTLGSFAANTVDSGATTRALEISNYYRVQKNGNPSFLSKQFEKYITTTWAKSSKYTVSKSHRIDLTTNVSSGSLPTYLLLQFGFTGSLTTSIATDIPANELKFSKLTLAKDVKRYSVDLFHCTEYASGRVVETKTGSGYVNEPVDSYYIVQYQS